MSPGLFILAISFYLVSMAGALVSSFFSRLIPSRFTNTLIIFHFLSIFTWLLLPKEGNTISTPGTSNYMFLIFFCSGIISAGLVLREHYAIYFKVYFSLFILSVLVFVVSPSRVIGFVASGNLQSINPKRYHIGENYFFVQQQSAENAESSQFKLVREMGMFHKTLARNIYLPAKTDSIKLNNFVENEEMMVTVYSTSLKNDEERQLIIDLKIAKDSSRVITRKPL